MNGTYVSAGDGNLFRYADKRVFTYNMCDHQLRRSQAILSDVSGRQLTYAEATGERQLARAGRFTFLALEFPVNVLLGDGDQQPQ
jgi:hypothetical protein